MDSPEWRQLQSSWSAAVSATAVSAAGEAVAEAALAEQRRRVELLGQRVGRLDEAAVRRVELDQDLAEAELALPRLEAELTAARVGRRQAGAEVAALQRQAASLTGLSVAELTAPASSELAQDLASLLAEGSVEEDGGGGPGATRDAGELSEGGGIEGAGVRVWQVLARVPMRAARGGVVESLAVTTGQWVQPGDEVLQTIVADALRFRAEALLGDVVGLRDGMQASVVPPRGLAVADTSAAGPGDTGWAAGQAESSAWGGAVAGVLRVGPTAHAVDRTVTLYLDPAAEPRGARDGDAAGRTAAGWARAGGPGFLEVVRGGAGREGGGGGVLAIPRAALVQDGLSFVFFRRDPSSPERVQRVVAQTGASDGRWVQLLNPEVSEGDRIVLDGVYQLLAASSSTLQQGGHFHSDGTFHEGEDE